MEKILTFRYNGGLFQFIIEGFKENGINSGFT